MARGHSTPQPTWWVCVHPRYRVYIARSMGKVRARKKSRVHLKASKPAGAGHENEEASKPEATESGVSLEI